MSMKRIAITSNYDSETYNEQFFSEHPVPEHIALEICEALNSINPSGPDYYQPKPVDYQLYKFQP